MSQTERRRKVGVGGGGGGLHRAHSGTPAASSVKFLFYTSPMCVCVLSQLLQSCPTLCDPMNCRLLGSSVHGILLARILEWVAMPSSRGSSPPRD